MQFWNSKGVKSMWKEKVKAAAIRAIKTMAQTAIGVIGAAAALGDVNWPMVGSASVLAGLVSVLTSIGGLPEVQEPSKEVEPSEQQ